MVVHRPDVILEALGVVQGFDFTLDRLVLDLAVSLAQPVAFGIDALLAGLAVLPNLVALRHSGQAQAVRQDLRDKGFVWHSVGEADHYGGALLGEAEHAGFLSPHGCR